jgi:hypothetical protein
MFVFSGEKEEKQLLKEGELYQNTSIFPLSFLQWFYRRLDFF